MADDTLERLISNLISISRSEAEGQPRTLIDSFDGATAYLEATPFFSQQSNFGSYYTPESSLGDVRDLFVEAAPYQPSDDGSESYDSALLQTSSALLQTSPMYFPGMMKFSSDENIVGRWTVIWDGTTELETEMPSEPADLLNKIGLGGIDLIQDDATGIRIFLGANVRGTAAVTIYSGESLSESRSYTAKVQIPKTLEDTPEGMYVYVDFSEFEPATGTWEPDFPRHVGAIQLEIPAASNADQDPIPGLTGSVTSVDTAAPTMQTYDLLNTPNDIDLGVEITVDDAKPNVGGSIIVSVTVTNNNAYDDATGVVIDVLSTGLDFELLRTQYGSYDKTTGLWTVTDVEGDSHLAVGASVSLDLIAQVTSLQTETVTARVAATDQPDKNLANNQASVVIEPQQADLSLTLQADDLTPNADDLVTLVATLTNHGRDMATNVNVELDELLSEDFELKEVTARSGSFDGLSTWYLQTVLAGETPPELTIVVRVKNPGTKTMVAEVISADQYDPDSPHGNDNSEEDDQASVTIAPRGRISGTAWRDDDNDGARGADELGMRRVKVYLDLDRDGIRDAEEPYQETSADDPTTLEIDESGRYEFVGLQAGAYVVGAEAPEGHEIGFPNAGHGHGHSITIGVGEVIGQVDFGVLPILGQIDPPDPLRPVTVVETRKEKVEKDDHKKDDGGPGVGNLAPVTPQLIIYAGGSSGAVKTEPKTSGEANGKGAGTQSKVGLDFLRSIKMAREIVPTSLAVNPLGEELSTLLRNLAGFPAAVFYAAGEQVPSDLADRLDEIPLPDDVPGLPKPPSDLTWVFWTAGGVAVIGMASVWWLLRRKYQASMATLQKARKVSQFEVWDRIEDDSTDTTVEGVFDRGEDVELHVQELEKSQQAWRQQV